MTQWNDDELAAVGTASELTISVQRSDGSYRLPVPIWAVRVDGRVFIRSWKGTGGAWFRLAHTTRAARIESGGVAAEVKLADVPNTLRADIDAAYRSKFGRGGYVDAMVTDQAAGASFELLPEADT